MRSLRFAARCATYAPNGASLAVGGICGSVCILCASTLADLVTVQHRTTSIIGLKFSPSGRTLAVASEMTLDLYNCETLPVWSLKRTGVCKGHAGLVKNFDWNVDGTTIQSTSNQGELLFWNVAVSPPAKLSPSAARDEQWSTLSCTLGWSVQGIVHSENSFRATQSCAIAHSRGVIAAGSFGKLKLFRYPCVDHHSSSWSQRAHGESVVSIRWSCNDEYVVSVGGSDLAICQWRHIQASAQAKELDGNAVSASSDRIIFVHRVVAATTIQRSWRFHKVRVEIAARNNRLIFLREKSKKRGEGSGEVGWSH